MVKRRIVGALGLVLAAILLLRSDAALEAAQNGLDLWWNAVFPSLFPFFVCVGMLEAGGLFPALSRLFAKLSDRLLLPRNLIACFLVGAVSGYPAGARICGSLFDEESVAYVNLCSPIFIVGVVAHSMLGKTEYAFPILCAHYGAAVVGALVRRLAFGFSASAGPAALLREPKPFSLIDSVSDGVTAMLRIGGSIVFFLVISALCDATGVFSALSAPFKLLGIDPEFVHALLTGLMEFTSGCRAAAALQLAPRQAVALSAAIISFGGLCVFIQARMFLPFRRPWRYLAEKLFQAVVAYLIAFFTAPLFFPAGIPVMADDAEQIMQNAMAGGSLFVISAVTMAFIYLVALVASRLSAARRNGSAPSYRRPRRPLR